MTAMPAPEGDFTCEFCVRPGDPHYSGPTIEDDATPMSTVEIWTLYHDRRWLHYDQDFRSSDGLRRHLEARVRYWFGDQLPAPKEAVASAMEEIDAAVGMWERRRRARADRRAAVDELFGAEEEAS